MKDVQYGSEKTGIIRPEDLPKPIIKKVSRNFRRQDVLALLHYTRN